MKIEILRITDQGFKREEYKINSVKGSNYSLSIDIERVGWRTIVLDDCASYTIEY